MKLLRPVSGLGVTLLLVSCATSGGYQEPAVTNGYATISNQTEFSSSSTAIVDVIDNHEIDRTWTSKQTVRIKPGHHVIKVTAYNKNGLFDNLKVSKNLTLSFNATAGNAYKLGVKMNGDILYTWVKNSAGQAVSGVASAEYMPAGSHEVDVKPLAK